MTPTERRAALAERISKAHTKPVWPTPPTEDQRQIWVETTYGDSLPAYRLSKGASKAWIEARLAEFEAEIRKEIEAERPTAEDRWLSDLGKECGVGALQRGA